MKKYRLTKQGRRLSDNIQKTVAVVLLGFIIVQLGDTIIHPEAHLSTNRYHLQTKISNGDKEAKEYYITSYLERGVFLFNDDVTVNYIATTYGTPEEDIRTVMNYTGVSTQEFYDKYIK